MAKRIYVLNDLNGKGGDTLKKGKNALKSKETLKRVVYLAGGSLLGQVAVGITNKIASSLLDNKSQKIQYALGTASSGAVTMAMLGLGQTDLGFGSAMVTANQLINTASTLATGKNLTQLLS
jgi:hypothetical protein